MASLDPAQRQPDKAGRLSRRKGGRATSPVSVVNDKSSELSHDSMPTVIGRYEITAFLGAGQMGCVYRGRDTVLGRDVAIKVPKLEGSGPQAVLIRRFYREARAVARLTHRSICPIYDVGEVDGKTFIAMGFVNGKTLDHFVGRGNFLKPRSAARLVHRICLAMQHAHENNVVHRDLKTSNIMVEADGAPVLLDFGLAILRDEKDAGLSFDGQILGSPAYMAPEQVNGQRVDHRADIFSLGVVFYESLTGERPFQGNLAKVLLAISQGSFVPPLTLNSEIGQELSDICLKMMHRSRDDRFQSMERAAESLAAFLRRSGSAALDGETATGPDVQPATPGNISNQQHLYRRKVDTVNNSDSLEKHRSSGPSASVRETNSQRRRRKERATLSATCADGDQNEPADSAEFEWYQVSTAASNSRSQASRKTSVKRKWNLRLVLVNGCIGGFSILIIGCLLIVVMVQRSPNSDPPATRLNSDLPTSTTKTHPRSFGNKFSLDDLEPSP